MNNIERESYQAALKYIESAKEMPLSVIGEGLRIVENPSFTDDDGEPATCFTRKFKSLEEVREYLSRDGVKVYLYKLNELQKYGKDLQPTGEKHYYLRCCVRKINR